MILDTDDGCARAKQTTTSDCPPVQADLAALTSALASAATRQVVVASHHPLATGGHGSYFGWKDFFCCEPEPLVCPPAASPAYPLAQWRDLEPGLRGHLNKGCGRPWRVFRTHPRCFTLPATSTTSRSSAGQARATWLSPAAATTVGPAPWRRTRTLFARATSGYMRLDLAQDGHRPFGGLVVDREGHAIEPF